jgi:hypothetical protein
MDGFQDSLKLAFSAENSGAEEARTPNLGIANAALSQLSYRPKKEIVSLSLVSFAS